MIKVGKKKSEYGVVQDIWNVARTLRFIDGFSAGIAQYIFGVFLYIMLGGAENPHALKQTISIFILNNILILFSEIPTGAIGDYFGRKKSIVTACFLASLSFCLKSFLFFLEDHTQILSVAVFSTLSTALAFTFYSGSFVSWITDSISARNYEKGHAEILAHAFQYRFIGQLVGSAIGLSFFLNDLVFYAFAIGCMGELLCGLYCLNVMKETADMKFQGSGFNVGDSWKNMQRIITTAANVIFKSKTVSSIVVAYGSYLVMHNVVNYLWPIAMKDTFGVQKMTFFWFFLVYANIFAGLFGSRFARKISKKIYTVDHELVSSNLRAWRYFFTISLVISFLVLAIAALTHMSLLNLALFVFVISVFKFGYGFLNPTFNSLINYFIPPENSAQRATIISFSSMLITLVTALMLLPISGGSGKDSILGWLLPAGITVILLIAMNFRLKNAIRWKNECEEKEGELETTS